MSFFTILLLILSSRLAIYWQRLWLLFLVSLVSERVTILATSRQFHQCNGLSVSSSFEIPYPSVLTNSKGAYPLLYVFPYGQPSFYPAFYFDVVKINIYFVISVFSFLFKLQLKNDYFNCVFRACLNLFNYVNVFT